MLDDVEILKDSCLAKNTGSINATSSPLILRE